MADILIRFTGDASGLASFYSGVARQTDAFVNRLTKTYQGQFNNILGTKQFQFADPFLKNKDGSPVIRTYGTAVRGLKYEFDQLNDVIKVTAESGLRLSNGTFLPVGQTTRFNGSVSALTQNLIKQEEQLALSARSVGQYERAVASLNRRRDTALAVASPFGDTRDSAAVNLAQLRAQRNAITELLRERQKFTNTLKRPLSGVAAERFDDRTNTLLQQRAALQKQVEQATRQLTKAQLAYDQALSDPRITGYDTRLNRLQTALDARKAQYNTALTALREQEASILTSAPNILPKGYQQLPPQLRNLLQKGGLANTAQALYGQGAQFTAPSLDLVRGVTDYSGQFNKTLKDGSTILTRWSAEVDKSGRVVTRFGGQLSGVSKIGSQIVRDFQKVIEWTVATTVVFGGLATAIQGLESIKQLDVDLKRFSITANLTSRESAIFFDQISQVAQSTATPLEEMVKAADDIALAVQKPGQSTEQLTHDVLALAEAVGIFTNLTGQDTVTATNQLVAVMKQLGLTAGSVVGVLDKITAVAGGQSQAISDITQGLSVMAEAGKQANLTVDQQIATIQVLSQVTSKSPAEIATAFKNLVGAIQNPAGVKALAKYKIALHDLSTGELRNLIDIYTEIQQKISSGVIPQGEVSKLIRDISGGPRRAPDAAALLANIGTVNKTTATSINATNEALLANAQILDTVQAKFVQFQNAIKSRAFQQLIGAFRELTAAAIQLGTSLIHFIGSIPPGLITFAAKAAFAAAALGLFFKVAKGVGALFSAVGVSLGALSKAQVSVGEAAVVSAKLYDASGNLIVASATKQAAAITTLGKIKAGLGRYGGAIGSAALGAGVSAALGSNPLQIAGAGLQGLGVGLLTIPEPTGLTKAAGIIALLGGTLLPQLSKSEDDSAESARQHAQAVLQVYDAYRQSLTTLNESKETQKTLNDEFDRINKQKVKTPEDLNRLTQIQKELADNFQTSVVASSDLRNSLTELAGVDPGLANLADQAARGALSIHDLDLEIQHLQKDVLKTQFPELQLPSDQTIPTFKPIPASSTQGGNVATGFKITPGIDTVVGSAPAIVENLTVDLTKLGEKGNDVRDIFDKTGKSIVLAFDPSSFNIGAIQSALAALPDSEAAFRDAALETIKAFGVQNNEMSQAVALLSLYNAQLDKSKPFITAQDYDRAQKFLALLNSIIQAYNGGFINKAQFDDLFGRATQSYKFQQENTASPEAAKQQSFAFDVKNYVEQLAEATGQLKGLTKGSDEAKAKLNEFGLLITGIPNLFDPVGASISDVTETINDLADALDKVKADTLDSLASKSLQLFNDLKNGTLKTSEYNKAKAALDEQRIAVIQLTDAYKEAALDGGESFVKSLQDLSKGLEKIPGLENASSLSGDQLIARLLEIASTMGFTKAETDKFTKAMLKMISTAKLIDGIKSRLGISVEVSGVKALKQILIGMRAAILGQVAIAAVLGGPKPDTSQLSAINAALAELAGYSDNSAQQLFNVVKGASGTGGSGSSAKKPPKGPGLDISTLDLPDEIANASNRDAIIQEAIKRARALQSKIPGATKDAKNDIVELLKGTQRILEVRGIKDDYLRKALEELAAIEKKRLDFETKADTIRRIRVGAGSFAAIANVPVNSTTGVSLGGPQGPINITLNLNGTVLTPAQLAQFADLVAAALKRQIANG